MDQSSLSLLTPSLPSFMDAPDHHHHHHHHHHLPMDFSRDEDAVNQGIVGSDNGDDDDDVFEFRSPVSEWDEQPSSPSLVNFSPTTSHLLLPSLNPTPFFKPPPPPFLSPPVSKPYPTSIANLSEEEDSPPYSKSSHSEDTLEDPGSCNKEARALREKLPKLKKCKLKDLLSRSGIDKQPRSPVPHSWPGRQGSGKKGMNETVLGIMGIKVPLSFLHPTAPILKSSFPSPTRKVVSAASSPSRQEVFCNSKLKHQKKTQLPCGQGFLGCLPFSSKFNPPVSELTAA